MKNVPWAFVIITIQIVIGFIIIGYAGSYFNSNDWWGDRVYVEGIIEDKSPSLIHESWVMINGKMYHSSKETNKLDVGYLFEGYLYEWR